MEENIREDYGTPEPQTFALTAVPYYFREGDNVVLKNNFIYDLVNASELPETVNETYPERKGKITGIYFNVLKNRYFYGVCPEGKDKEDPGSNEYYFEETLIYNMKDLFEKTFSEEQRNFLAEMKNKLFGLQGKVKGK